MSDQDRIPFFDTEQAAKELLIKAAKEPNTKNSPEMVAAIAELLKAIND